MIRPVPEHARKRLVFLVRLALPTSTRYGGAPVYLTGSALYSDNPKPRDWDIRVNLPARDFLRFYGDPIRWATEGVTGSWTDVRWRWSEDCVKQGRAWYERTGLNVDFQTQPLGYARTHYAGEPKLRLDRLPSGMGT